MTQRVVSYQSGYERLSTNDIFDGCRCALLEETQRVVSNADGFQTLAEGAIIDGSTCVILDTGQSVVSWDDGYLTCKAGSHVDKVNCLILNLNERIVSSENDYESCKIGDRPNGASCVRLGPGDRVVSHDDGYQTCKSGSVVDGGSCIILSFGQRVVSHEDGYQTLAPGSVVDNSNVVVLNDGERVVSWEDGFQSLRTGSIVDGRNCVILGADQRVVSWEDGYVDCRTGSRVDGSNVVILDRGDHVVSWDDGYQTCKPGSRIDGVNCVVLKSGQRVVSWDDGYQTCKPGSRIDGTNCVILDAGQRVVSWDDGYKTCRVGSKIDNTNCIILDAGHNVRSYESGYIGLKIGNRLDHTKTIVINDGRFDESDAIVPSSFFSAAAQPGQPIAAIQVGTPLNLSGSTQNGTASTFTLGGWVRVKQAGAEQVLFDAPGQFRLSIGSDGTPSGAFTAAASGNSVRSAGKITDNGWHFVAVSFQQAAGIDGGGTLSIYIDGLPTHGSVSTGLGPNSNQYTLGAAALSDDVEIVTWELWQSCLSEAILSEPIWGLPMASDPAGFEQLTALDFSNRNITSSNPHVTVTASQHRCLTGCLMVPPDGQAVMEDSFSFAAGTQNRWSLMCWVRLPDGATQGGSCSLYRASDATSGGTPENSFAVQLTTGAAQGIEILTTVAGAASVTLVQQPHGLTDWTHVGLTYDGATLVLYINGAQVAQHQGAALPASLPDQVFADTVGLAGSSGNLLLQGLSVWSRDLDPDEIVSVMNTMESRSDGLQALLPFLVDKTDMVRGVPILVEKGALGYDETPLADVASSHVPATETAAIRRAASGPGGSLLTLKDHRDAARWAGIDTPTDHARRHGADSAIAEVFAKLAPDMPPTDRQRVVDRFSANYSLGYEMRARGVHHGSVQTRKEGGGTVFYYNTLSGPAEVLRVTDNLSPMDVWLITILLDVIFVIFALAGVATTPNSIRRATRGRIIRQILTGLASAVGSGSPTVSSALVVVGNVVNLLNNAGLLVSILWNIISYSWWNLFFCLASLVASALSIFLLPASAVWRAANAGLAIGVLVYDLTQKPKP